MGDKLTAVDDIAVRFDREKAYGIANGETEMHQGREREKIFWIPKSLEGVELSEDGTSIIMPSWKALELGLI